MAGRASTVALSKSVKELIAKRGGPVQAQSGSNSLGAGSPNAIRKVLNDLQERSALSSQHVLQTIATGTFVTLNAPFALQQLWQWTQRTPQDAELLREAGLKCISFIGIAKVINNLGVLHECFRADGVHEKLSMRPRRKASDASVLEATTRGNALWDSIYDPYSRKLVDKLAVYHPDLPVHIIESHYSLLLSDPEASGPLGRTLTSVLAIACLQAQTGVGSQTTSHVFGLKKALGQSDEADTISLQPTDKEWLCGDEGARWILESIESLREAVFGHAVPVPKAKL